MLRVSNLPPLALVEHRLVNLTPQDILIHTSLIFLDTSLKLRENDCTIPHLLEFSELGALVVADLGKLREWGALVGGVNSTWE